MLLTFCGLSQLPQRIGSQRHGHYLRLAGIRGDLGMARVPDERCRDTDLVKEMCFRMRRVESFADLAEVVVQTICTAIANASDGDDLAVVAGHTAMYVGFPLSLVLGLISTSIRHSLVMQA